jgi:hypothetical protein
MPRLEWYAVVTGSATLMQKVSKLLEELNSVHVDSEVEKEIIDGHIVVAMLVLEEDEEKKAEHNGE